MCTAKVRQQCVCQCKHAHVPFIYLFLCVFVCVCVHRFKRVWSLASVRHTCSSVWQGGWPGRQSGAAELCVSIYSSSFPHTHTHSEGCPSPTSSHQPPPVHSSRQEWKGVVIWAVLPVSTIPNTHTRNVFTITNWNNPLSYMSISDSQETLQSDGTHRMRTSDTYWVKRTS